MNIIHSRIPINLIKSRIIRFIEYLLELFPLLLLNDFIVSRDVCRRHFSRCTKGTFIRFRLDYLKMVHSILISTGFINMETIKTYESIYLFLKLQGYKFVMFIY